MTFVPAEVGNGPTPARFVVVGSGKMPSDLLRALCNDSRVSVVLALADARHETANSQLCDAAAEWDVPCLIVSALDADMAARLHEMKIDYIISANNHMLFKGPHIAAARKGVLNFHNGPLPRYAGINTCSWAILNCETEYGVTWHFVDEGIDTGAIARQRMFRVESDATAIELIAQCIEAGIEMFPDLLVDLLKGRFESLPQSPHSRTFYRRRDVPWNGDFPFWISFSQLDRLSRALSFWPVPNLFYRVRIRTTNHGIQFAERFLLEADRPTEWPVGWCRRDNADLLVTVDGGHARLIDVFDDTGERVEGEKLPDSVMLNKA